MPLRQRHSTVLEPRLLRHQPLETEVDLSRTSNQPLEVRFGLNGSCRTTKKPLLCHTSRPHSRHVSFAAADLGLHGFHGLVDEHGAGRQGAGQRIVHVVVEFVEHALVRLGGQQRNHHDEQQRNDERRQQLIDGEYAAQGLDEVVPEQHGRRAGQHAGHGAGLVGATPV